MEELLKEFSEELPDKFLEISQEIPGEFPEAFLREWIPVETSSWILGATRGEILDGIPMDFLTELRRNSRSNTGGLL